MRDQKVINAWQREHRKKNNNILTRNYEKTKKGFLMRLYRNMKSRVSGAQKMKAHLYEGKDLLNKEDFYDWAFTSITFHRLWKYWEESGFERRLTPSVDRVNSKLGYSIENMEWVQFHVNCSRGSASPRHK